MIFISKFIDFLFMVFVVFYHEKKTLYFYPKTNNLPLKIHGWKMNFLLKWPPCFTGHVRVFQGCFFLVG